MNDGLSDFEKTINEVRRQIMEAHCIPEHLLYGSDMLHTFRTTHGMIEILKKITWRAKIVEKISLECIIYVPKKYISNVQRLTKELGMVHIKYEVKKIGFFECWFKRFKVIERKSKIYHADSWKLKIKGETILSCGYDPASKEGDYSAETTMERKDDGTFEVLDINFKK